MGIQPAAEPDSAIESWVGEGSNRGLERSTASQMRLATRRSWRARRAGRCRCLSPMRKAPTAPASCVRPSAEACVCPSAWAQLIGSGGQEGPWPATRGPQVAAPDCTGNVHLGI